MEQVYTWTVRIYYEDTDVGGVVYHANYLKFYERARTEWMREHGLDLAAQAKEGRTYIVRHAQVEYLKPAHLNDLLTIRSCIESCKKASLIFVQAATNQDQVLVSTAKIKVASICTDTLKPIRLPKRLSEEMLSVN